MGTTLASEADGDHEAHAHDDFAQTRVPKTERRSSGTVFMVLVGISSAFLFPAIGGDYLQAYGARATFIGLTIGFVIVVGLSLIVSSAASREGLTAELLTRGCGYGYAGTILTAFIYGVTFTVYSALEGQILASSIDQLWDLPDIVWYVFAGLIFIPLSWWGMSQLPWIMWVTIPIYILLVGAAIVIALDRNDGFPADFLSEAPEGSTVGALGLVGVMAGLAGTIALDPLEAGDYNRFIAPDKFRRSAPVSVVLPWAIMFLFAIPLGVFFTLATDNVSTNPAVYFSGLLGPVLGVLLAWISQIRINVTNVHLGSIAFTSASERIGLKHLGRKFWIVVVSAASVLLMYSDVLGNVLTFLEWTGLFLMAWLATIIADLVIVRRCLKVVSGPIEYQQSRIRAVNPVGVTALIGSIAIGSFFRFGIDNAYLNGLAAYITFGIAVSLHTVMALWTRGRYYTKALEDPPPEAQSTLND